MSIEAWARETGTLFAAMILVCAVSFTAAAGQTFSADPHRQHAQETRKPQANNTTAAPASPVPKQSPAPPPPVVSYREGLLGITAQNATLGDILDKVCESTGATIEAPALQERISVQLRPRPPAQAIAALLEGLHLNYAILGGTNDQIRIERIIVAREPSESLQPAAPPQAPVLEDVAAKVRAQAMIQFAEQTGGDEGVWENRPQSSLSAQEPISSNSSVPSHQ